jgi:hypothetical protein
MADYRAQRLARIRADYERFTAQSNPMTENNITPPPELVQEWVAEIWHEGTAVRVALSDEHIATRAAQWGADQELEASVSWLVENQNPRWADALYAARRRKPPSLKEQALADFDWLVGRTLGRPEFDERSERIRRALEQLPE